ncbi:MAG: aspartate ammonia-lyase [bacterium]|nr:aspartate ammonia-lyase [bacterium]
MSEVRIEHDLLGTIEVPAEALYGAQTQRAVLNFPLRSEKTIGDYPLLIAGLMAVKKAAAAANRRAGFLEEELAGAIDRAADTVLREPLLAHFPVHRFHGGGGTSANMNANEVLANLAEEALGGRRGEYRRVHPNDHVNRHQSTNDVYPTACHLALAAGWHETRPECERLAKTLAARAQEWRELPRLARTCLQDAVEGTYGELFGGYAGFIERATARIDTAVEALHAVNLGGTVVGQPAAVPRAYFEAVIPELRRVTGDDAWRRAANLADAFQNCDDMVNVSAQLATAARGLIKIAKDLRLLGSGPQAGLGEIRLPAVQPGSSIMPGKVNPVIPEFAIQLCLEITGLHAACAQALDHGELDLNVWESLIVFNTLDAMEHLANAATVLDGRCLRDLTVDEARSRAHAESMMPLLTRLVDEHGYARISELCRRAGGDLIELRRLLFAAGLMSDRENA